MVLQQRRRLALAAIVWWTASSSRLVLVWGFSMLSQRRPRTRIRSRQDRDVRHDIRLSGIASNTDVTDQDFIINERCDDATAATTESHKRRSFLQSLAAASSVLAATTIPDPAGAGLPELDRNTGQLYSPRTEMLAGGSQAARGIPGSSNSKGPKLQAGQALQTVYETRFIAYLARFLLNFDPSAHAWWIKQGLGDSWDNYDPENSSRSQTQQQQAAAEETFAEFAESVEVGLADYFVGPYGSYSSVAAAKAGVLADQPARSSKPDSTRPPNWLALIFGQRPQQIAKEQRLSSSSGRVNAARDGILNLYALLKARYTSVTAKRQLAILFSLVSSPLLQPTNEIRALLGEADNATVTEVQAVVAATGGKGGRPDESNFRTSSRRGGGYSIMRPPTLIVAPPPALGDDYRVATLAPTLECTSRVLRITVTDGGAGYYAVAPAVTIIGGGMQRVCQATAVIDRHGHVESIVVLDPGFGYGGLRHEPPRVKIEPPRRQRQRRRNADGSMLPSSLPAKLHPARAIAELEYRLVGAQIVEPGNGYVRTEPPAVVVSPPEQGDPDWFLAVQEQPEMRMIPTPDPAHKLLLQVTEMRDGYGNVAYSRTAQPDRLGASVTNDLLQRVMRDPLELLPSSVRPVLRTKGLMRRQIFVVPPLDEIPQTVSDLSPRYRACDPIFGGIGRLPVIKGANALSAGEYARLALSGAVCTVIVRTALNPLELVKTKQQLQNDDELLRYARKRQKPKPLSSDDGLSANENSVTNDREAATKRASSGTLRPSNTTQATEVEGDGSLAVATKIEGSFSNQTRKGKQEGCNSSISTAEMIKSIIELRGPVALFQSSDITFLASLMFGSFGFGATELFRRAFTDALVSDSSNQGTEWILLLAAAVATVVTAAAASPFELLRVRSMGLVDPQPWTNVLQTFLYGEDSRSSSNDEDFDLSTLNPREVLPLWAGFAPTLSRELPFAVAKFLTFDMISETVVAFLNTQAGDGALPIQAGVGPVGLTVSALAGALAGIAGATVSHPADLILTYTSARNKKDDGDDDDWKDVVKELLRREGGPANLFIGLPARAAFFFLVIGLQFWLYDLVKSLLQVGQDDLSLVLDVFYAVRAGLVDMIA